VAFAGEVVSQVLEERRAVDLVVRFAAPWREDAAAVRGSWIDTAGRALCGPRRPGFGGPIAGPNMISRENVQRKIVIQANVAGRDVGSVVEEIRERVGTEVSSPGRVLRRLRRTVRERR
jgi:Cu/Ag efflux pump CusA